MEYIRTLRDEHVFKTVEHQEHDAYAERQTVKVIVENQKGEIALLCEMLRS